MGSFLGYLCCGHTKHPTHHPNGSSTKHSSLVVGMIQRFDNTPDHQRKQNPPPFAQDIHAALPKVNKRCTNRDG